MPPSRDPFPPPNLEIHAAPPLHSPLSFSKRGPSAVKKRLFGTPANLPKSYIRTHDTSQSIPTTPSILNQTITKRHFHTVPLHTPTPSTTSLPPSSSKSAFRALPPVATLDATPSMRRKYHIDQPNFWRTIQSNDLIAWLNSILVPQPLTPSVTSQPLSKHHLFQKHLCAMANLYKHTTVAPVLAKVDAEIFAGRFFIDRKIHMATHHQFRDKLVELLLLNYHPMWLLLALSVVLSRNLAFYVDDAFQQFNPQHAQPNHEQVFMAVLEDALKNLFLNDRVPHPNFVTLTSTPSRKFSWSPDVTQKDPFNALVLSRVLHLVFLLDNAKEHKPSIVTSDPPLFRFGSKISSSEDLVKHLTKHFLPDHGNVVRFLSLRGYKLTYVRSLLERNSLVIRRLDKDLCDGVRLCKLASLLSRDSAMLASIRREESGMSGREISSCNLGNVSLALSKIQKYAGDRLGRSLKWEASNQDIVGGDIDKIIAVLWQVSGLWLQINVLDHDSLTTELEIVEREFREAKRQSPVSTWSPGGTTIVPNLDENISSPSGLTVYEKCKTQVGYLLLRWCATIAGMYGITVRDFTESFRDAAPLCVIVHHYCPEVIKAGEFIRVSHAELRSVKDSEEEGKIVQRNFDLFTSRVRLLGDVPDIPIRSEAALAAPFTETKKNESFGRLMELLSSYLFQRLTRERGEKEECLPLPECFLMQPEIPKSLSPQQPVDTGPSFTSEGQGNPSEVFGDSQVMESDLRLQLAGQGKSIGMEQVVATSSTSTAEMKGKADLEGQTHEVEERPNPSTTGGSNINSSDDTECSNPLSKVSSLDLTDADSTTSKKDAVKVIMRLYRAKKQQKEYQTRRESAVAIQACFRGHLIREDTKAMANANRISGLRHALEINDCSDAEEGFVSAKSSPMHVGSLAKAPPSEKGFRVLDATKSVLSQAVLLLPLFRDHMRGMRDFSARMILHERTQASLAVQRSLRAYMASKIAVTSTADGVEREPSTIPWLKLTSGPFKIVRSIASEFVSQVEAERKVAINILIDCLRKAENSYVIEMSRCSERDERNKEKLAHRRDESLAAQMKYSEEESQEMQALIEDMQSLDKDVVNLNNRLAGALSIFESDKVVLHREVQSDGVVSSDPVELSDVSILLRETPRKGSEDQLPVVDDSAWAELQKIRKEQEVILDEIQMIEADMDASLEARSEEVQRCMHLIMSAALLKSEYEFTSFMHSADISRADYAQKISARNSEISAIGDELASLRTEAANDLSAISKTLDNVEGRCVRAEEAFECQLDRTANLACLAYKAVDQLKTKEEGENRASFCSAIEEKSFEFRLSRFNRELREFDEWRRAADKEQKLLDMTINKLENEELREQSCEKLRQLLGRAEGEFNVAMDKSIATAKRQEVARDEHKFKLAVISSEDAISRKHFDENIQSLNKALTGLDDMMEERNSYLKTLSTPGRNVITPTPDMGNISKSKLIASATPGTRCEELINAFEKSLQNVDIQRNLEFDDGKSLDDTPESSKPDRDSERFKEDFFHVPRLPDRILGSGNTEVRSEHKHQGENLNAVTSENGVSDPVEAQDSTQSLRENSKFNNLYPSDIEGDVSSQRRDSCDRVIEETTAHEKDSQSPSYSCGHVTEPEVAIVPAANDGDCPVMGVSNVGFIEECVESEGSESSRSHGDGWSSNHFSLHDSDIAITGISLSGSQRVPEPERDQVSNEVSSNIRDRSDGFIDGDENSDWTNETTRGSPLPQELSPDCTGRAGSSLTSKRSSIRESNSMVFTPIENKMNYRDSARGNEKGQNSLTQKRVHLFELSACPVQEVQGMRACEDGCLEINENSPPNFKIPDVHQKSEPCGKVGKRNFTSSNQRVPREMDSVEQIPVQIESQRTNSFGKTVGTLGDAVQVSVFPENNDGLNPTQTPLRTQGATARWLQSASNRDPFSSSFESPAEAWADHTPTVPSSLLSSFLRSNAFSSLEKPQRSDLGSVCMPAWDSSRKGATPSSGGISVLRRLSIELSELKREISKESSIEKLAMSKNEVELGSILRRISMASAAQASQEFEGTVVDAVEDFSVLNIIRVICTIMQKYRRSKPHLELVQLGILILRDMCNSPNWVDNVFLVEDCMGEIVRCVVFYWDNEEIVGAAVEALLAISSYPYGAFLLDGHRVYLRRLRRVSNFLQLQAQREKECGERMRRTDIVLRAIENRRKNQSGRYFAEELAEATKEVPEFKHEGRRSVQLLQTLFDRFPIMSEGAT